MDFDYITIFLIGFFGGFSHCIGMCGGFVMTYSLKIRENDIIKTPTRWQKVSPHLLYNAGRVLTYTVLGEIFGLAGGTLGVIFAIRDLQGVLQLSAGILMVLIGLDLAGWLSIFGTGEYPGIKSFKKIATMLFRSVNRRNVFVLGLILGLIPCGLVYVAGAKAAATQSVTGGALTMLVFGLGTFPAMLVTGFAADLISQKLRTRLYRFAAILVIILAFFTILRGIDNLGWYKFFWLV
jgi:sulfite exporter TauE/SafE